MRFVVAALSLGLPVGRFATPRTKKMDFMEEFVQRDEHRIYVRKHVGDEPPIILMHGFPDNLHLYDRVLPYLSPARRVITFDFLRWGASDKPAGYPYTAKNQEGDLDAVIQQQKLGQVVLVAYDASGPPAINWALHHLEQVASLALLNTTARCQRSDGRKQSFFSRLLLSGTSHGRSLGCSITLFSVACTGGRLVDSSGVPRLEANSCFCCISNSMPCFLCFGTLSNELVRACEPSPLAVAARTDAQKKSLREAEQDRAIIAEARDEWRAS
jgi:hypothetical protein